MAFCSEGAQSFTATRLEVIPISYLDVPFKGNELYQAAASSVLPDQLHTKI